MPSRFKKPGIGFLDLAVSQLKKAKTFLNDVERIVDWAPIEKLLKKKLRRNQDAVGNPAYPPLGMFKVLLLQRWYNLSDQGMDDALADKGYASADNRTRLEKAGITDGIMYKAARGRKLSEAQRLMNRVISGLRGKVERAFGTLKRDYGFHRARYMGRLKVQLEFLLNAMAFNLKKAALMLE
ncbi:MAG: transposase [Thermodesulfobacteriota bacterium]